MSKTSSWALNALYLLALAVASPAILWGAIRHGKHRQGYAEKLLGRTSARKGDRTCVWIHAVSVGEVNLIGVLLDELQRRHPKWELCVSTTTKTGYELARKRYRRRHAVFYCPLDFSWAVNRAVRRVRPDLLVLAELELWPNLISAAKNHGAKVAVVNGRLSDGSFKGYSRVRGVLSRVLQKIDLVAAQDETTAERFRRLGSEADSTIVTGSLKYDGAETDRDNPRTVRLRELAAFGAEDRIWVAGSTQAPEEAICLNAYRELREDHPGLRLVIAPRHPQRFDEAAALLNESGLPWVRRSELDYTAPDSEAVILVDTVGELGAWWGVADYGFVGGSFGDRGGQNMIEPTAYGVATCFGPNTRNFRDVVAALTAADGARVVRSEAELEAFVGACLAMPIEAAGLGVRARKLVLSQLGATTRTADAIEALVGVEEVVMPIRIAA